MKKRVFIETPMNMGAYRHLGDFDHPGGWQKRARKLQERRWRKISGRLMRRDDSVHLRPKHQAFN